MTTGYSGTPLWKKLGLKGGMHCAALNAPDGDPLPLLDGAPDVETDDPQRIAPALVCAAS
jgi:hypothetical protein